MNRPARDLPMQDVLDLAQNEEVMVEKDEVVFPENVVPVQNGVTQVPELIQ